jgi:hypothetical protein
MTAMFEDLIIGLDEVDAFLAGENAGYKVLVETQNLEVIRPGRSLAEPEGETADPSATLRSGPTASRGRRDDKG